MIETTIERLINVARDFKNMPDAARIDHRVQSKDTPS